MATNNAINSIFKNNADGWLLGGGTTSRQLTLTGSNIIISGSADVTLSTQAQNGFITLQDSITLTAGSILFSDSTGLLTQDNANFFWDDTNNRLGIGETVPTARLHIKGSGATSSTSSLNVTDSAGSSSLFVRDDREIIMGGTTPLTFISNTTNLTLTGSMVLSDGAAQVGIQLFRSGVAKGDWSATLLGIQFKARNNNQVRFVDDSDNGFTVYDGGRIDLKSSLTGNTPPGSKLEITGEGTTSTTSGLSVVDSSANSLLFVRDDGNVGIGTNTPTHPLHIKFAPGINAPVMKAEASGTGDFFEISDGTAIAGSFAPAFAGTVVSSNLVRALNFLAEIDPTIDTGTVPVMTISAQQNDNTILTTRPLLEIESAGTTYLQMEANGDLGLGKTATSKLEIKLNAGSGGGIKLEAAASTSRLMQMFEIGTEGIIMFMFKGDSDDIALRTDDRSYINRLGGNGLSIGTSSTGSTLLVKGDGTTSITSSLDIQNSSGTSMLFVRDDGNVGIGTTTPSATLDVVGTFQYVDTNEAAGFVLTSDLSGNATWQPATATAAGSNKEIQFNDGGATGADSNFIWDKFTERLGIGISSPVADVNVNKSVASGSVNVRVQNSSSGTGANTLMQLLNNSNSGPQLISYSTTRTGVIAGISRANMSLIYFSGATTCVIGTNSASTPLVFSMNDVERVRITESTGIFQMTAARLQTGKASDVASADEITLGIGNSFPITGTTTINHINNTDWQEGSEIKLFFSTSVILTHNAATPAGTEASMKFAGSVDFSATAGDNITLELNGGFFVETSRMVA